MVCEWSLKHECLLVMDFSFLPSVLSTCPSIPFTKKAKCVHLPKSSVARAWAQPHLCCLVSCSERPPRSNHKIQCPATVQLPRNSLPARGAVYIALNWAQCSLISGLLISWECVTVHVMLPGGQEGVKNQPWIVSIYFFSNPEVFNKKLLCKKNQTNQ